MTEEKKSERLEVRLGFSEKAHFVDACDSQGDTPSGAIRRFIRGYVRRAESDWRASAWRGLTGSRRRGAMAVAGLGAVAASLAAFIILSGTTDTVDNPRVVQAMEEYAGVWPAEAAIERYCADQPSFEPPADCALFLRYDADEDGVLHPGDILPSDGPLFRVLDLDSDGMTLDEFWPRGRMTYTVADRVDVEIDAQGYPRIRARSTAFGLFRKPTPNTETRHVEFDLRGDWPVINSFVPDMPIVTAQQNRAVYWETDGERAVHVGNEHPFRPRQIIETPSAEDGA